MSRAGPLRFLHRAMEHRRDFGAGATACLVLENMLHPLSPGLARRARAWEVRRRNVSFDRRYGVDTASHAEPELPAAGSRYEPTDEASFLWMMRSLELDRHRFTFVDLGSGKGKAALLASRLGFGRVIGVEYDADLVQRARQNARAFSRHAGCRAPIEFVVGDATSWGLPSGDLLLYMFNPFGPELVRAVLDNARASLRREPRQIVVASYNVAGSAVSASAWLDPVVPSRELSLGTFRAWRIRQDP